MGDGSECNGRKCRKETLGGRKWMKKMKEKKVLRCEKEKKNVCFREREVVNVDGMECGSDIVHKDR